MVQQWCRVVIVGADGRVLARCSLGGPGDPGLGAVDELARLALLAGRLGGVMTLLDASPALGEMLDLAGLDRLVSETTATTATTTREGDLGVEMQRQAEVGEQPLVVERGEEEVHRRDPTA